MKTPLVLTMALTLPAGAQQLGGPMMHLLIGQSGESLVFGFETEVDGPLTMNRAGQDEFGGGASVLNGRGYNAQFGWLASGFFDLPAGSGVFVKTVTQHPLLSVYDAFGFEPILGTEGSSDTWQWSGAMTHNWYTSAKPGSFSATYEVYVGDASGVALDGWGSALVDLSWTFGVGTGVGADFSEGAGPVPAPASLTALAAVLAARRRRDP